MPALPVFLFTEIALRLFSPENSETLESLLTLVSSTKRSRASCF